MEEKDLTHAASQQSSEEHEHRLRKVAQLRSHGIEPWPAAATVTAVAAQVKDEYHDGITSTYQLAGRVMTMRLHGKAVFAHVQDETGQIQIYLKQDVIGDESFLFWEQNIAIGDVIWVRGSSFKTKTGEITIKVDQFKLLSKCLHPLPEKFHGLMDTEIRYRQRYLDLITNPDSRRKFKIRSNVLRYIRDYFDEHGYMEVETPMLHPIAGGALARPFITHHNALDTDFYLRIAPELYLKRLVVGGFEKVYEINRNFRNEGVSIKHNPEFTMLEFYTAHKDYHFIMDFLETLLRTVIKKACGSLVLEFGTKSIDFSQPFARMSVRDAVLSYGGFTPDEVDPKNINALLKKYHVDAAMLHASQGEKMFALFEEVAESKLINPTFITDYPIEVSPLAKRDVRDPQVAARFELFVAGFELANGFNELNDPLDQAERFQEQLRMHQVQEQGLHEYDADYVTALEYGLPPTVGVGMGIDRLVMLLTNTTSIKDVILFPTLKKK